jgi:hypothetical protein
MESMVEFETIPPELINSGCGVVVIIVKKSLCKTSIRGNNQKRFSGINLVCNIDE